MKKTVLMALLALLSATTVFGGPITLNSISFNETANGCGGCGGPNQSSSPGTVSFTTPLNNGGGTSTATIVSNSAAGLTMTLSSTGLTDATTDAFFYLEVAGPQNINVPLDVSGSTSVTFLNGNGETSGGAFAYIFIGAGQSVYLTACSGLEPEGFQIPITVEPIQACSTSNVQIGSGPFTTSTSIPTNTMIQVTLDAQTSTDDLFTANGTVATASIDPFFQLDPTFANSNPDYSLALSPGFNNVNASAIPEPSTGCLEISGLATIVYLVRHRASRMIA